MRQFSFIIACALIALIGLGLFTPQSQKSTVDIPEKHASYTKDVTMYASVEKIKPGFVTNDYIYGGIVSHHLLAAVDIARFYASFSKQKIDTVILVGPNHEGQGIEKIAVPTLDFETPWGDVLLDDEIIRRLVESGVVSIDDSAFFGEHSISVQVPYIRYYLPNVKIVPVVLKKHIDKKNLEMLSEALSKINDKKIVVIASVDFSHHTDKYIGNINDEKSIETISNFDLDGLYTLNIDSPNSIFVLLNYLKSFEATTLDYWRQNAADILNSPNYQDVTTYLFAFFRNTK